MYAFQRIRGFLFYLGALLFLAGLPFILSFALGYKFNPHTFKFVKTGLIYIKTQPEGAKIYLNNQLTPQKSPASIQELIPGVYKVTLELAQHYPWKGEISVEAGSISRADKIILFPLRPDIEQLNREQFSSFRVYAEKGVIYYLDQENRVVYKSNLDGSNFEDIASIPENFAEIKGWEVAADKTKLFIFNPRQIAVLFFDARDNYDILDSPVFLDYTGEKIIQVFWHSDSYHLVVVTDKHVAVIESRPRALPVNLVSLNREGTVSFYDDKRDTLYFTRPDQISRYAPLRSTRPYRIGRYALLRSTRSDNLYRLELNTDLFLLERLMKKKPNE